MNFVDEQAGERMHKRHKFSRPNLARKTTPEDNMYDIMVAALAWSDIKISYTTFKKRRNCNANEDHDIDLAQYYEGHQMEIENKESAQTDEESSEELSSEESSMSDNE